jgi:hypothetical protein
MSGAEGDSCVKKENTGRGPTGEMLRAEVVLTAKRKCSRLRKSRLTTFGLHSWLVMRPPTAAARQDANVRTM